MRPLILKLRRTETWQLVKEYAKAKKERLCPFVEFVNNNTNEPAPAATAS